MHPIYGFDENELERHVGTQVYVLFSDVIQHSCKGVLKKEDGKGNGNGRFFYVSAGDEIRRINNTDRVYSTLSATDEEFNKHEDIRMEHEKYGKI